MVMQIEMEHGKHRKLGRYPYIKSESIPKKVPTKRAVAYPTHREMTICSLLMPWNAKSYSPNTANKPSITVKS